MTGGADEKPRKALKLPDRFRTLRISENEYKLVSLYESMRVRLGPDSQGLLDVVLSRLSTGCDEEELFRIVGEPRRDLLIRVLGDLSSRGMLFGDHGDTEPAPTAQMRFFSNFRPLLDAPPEPGTVVAFNNARAAQDRLRAARVLVVGLGRIGSRLVRGLSAVGVGQIYGADSNPVGADDLFDSAYSREHIDVPRNDAIAHVAAIAGTSHYSAFSSDAVFDGAAALPDVDLAVLCEDTFDPGHHRTMNRLALERDMPWTSCRNLGHRIEVGPMIVPRESACWHCLELRRAGNQVNNEEYDATRLALAREGNSLGSLNVTLGYEILALEVVKILSRFCRPMTWNAVHTFDVITLEGRLHPVLKIPRCAACGTTATKPAFGIWNPGELFKEL